ncbi:MAG: rubrerythrin family protein [Candidatus Ranarchaeia archaeon]
MTTKENLEYAFAGESQANRKYLAFSKQAKKEGFEQVAKIFRAVAEAETVHAHNHLKVLGEVKTTLENLKAAIMGEIEEYENMYPKFMKEAEAEGEKDALRTFNFANEVEKIHAEIFKQAADAIKRGEDLSKAEVYVCPICGWTHIGVPPAKCPICFTVKEKFIQMK